MEEYKLFTSNGRILLYAADSAKRAVELATFDGYRIVKVEKYQIGYWSTIQELYWK